MSKPTDAGNCPHCNQRLPRHEAYNDGTTGHVEIATADPSDPFELLEPAPKPFTEAEATAAVRTLVELDSSGQLERWEATRRFLVTEMWHLFALSDEDDMRARIIRSALSVVDPEGLRGVL